MKPGRADRRSPKLATLQQESRWLAIPDGGRITRVRKRSAERSFVPKSLFPQSFCAADLAW
jgi:hypothetical protein